jgi:hypothetical protein
MAKSRVSGNELEGFVCGMLQQLRLTCRTPERLAKIVAGGGSQRPLPKGCEKLPDKIAAIVPLGASCFDVSSDHDGVRGITSDIIVRDEVLHTQIGISCKRNNFSIKHQRPGALARHLGLEPSNAAEYMTAYKHITGSFYEECRREGVVTFPAVHEERKRALYREVNALVAHTIASAEADQQARMIRYILSLDEALMFGTEATNFIMHWDDKKQDDAVKLYKLCIEHVGRVDSIHWEENTIRIDSGDVKLSLRLHNASSRITKSVSLKYDTKIVNKEFLLQEY